MKDINFKKLLVLLIGFSALMSCGNENKNETETTMAPNENIEGDNDSVIDIPDDAGPEEQLFAIPQNIEEYFYEMPFQWVMPDKVDDELSDEEKKAMILKKDLTNGYLKMTGTEGYEWPGYTEMGLWKKPDNGGDLIGVNIMEQYTEDAPKHRITFWEYKEGGWNDVTDGIFKPLTDKQIEDIYEKKIGGDPLNPMTGLTHVTYNLPVKGTTIEVVFEDNSNGEPVKVAEYKYTKGKFVISY